jgi:hypothetical protein
MHKRIVVVCVAVAALLAVSSAVWSQAADPWIGTWKVNLAKSTFDPGPKPTVAATVTIEPSAGGGIKTTIDATNAQGQPTHTETVGMFDGKDNPVQGTPAPNTTTAFTRIDNQTYQAMGKVDGKATTTTRVTISADGKTLTATQTGKTAQGQTVNNVIVADKQ